MKDFTDRTLNFAKLQGAQYCDIRIVESKNEEIGTYNGSIGDIDQTSTFGFGVRVLVNGSWGFSASNELNKNEIEKIVKQAIDVAKASSIIKNGDIKLADEPSYTDFWQTPVQINPFKVSIEEKINLLYEIDKILSKDSRIKSRTANLRFVNDHKWFASSEGSFIEQDLIYSGAGYSCVAIDKGENQVRSYPANFGGQYKSMGYELVNSLYLKENAERVREEAIQLLTADECPSCKKDLILMGSQLCLQIHESVGHATELDRVLGWESNFAGTSFATTEKLNNFKYGNEKVNLVADGTVPSGLATQGYDDDGVQSQRWHIVKNGILNGYMTTRETAHYIDQKRSRGCNRSQGYNDMPITRICNLSLMPGDISFDDMIASTDDGILMDINKTWSIDQKRLNFEFGCEVGWEIKNGKKTRLLKNPRYHGITYDFWNKLDKSCSHEHWDLWGVMNCGKGQPIQVARMSHGSSPTRFNNIDIC